MTVTKAGQEKLRGERPTPDQERHLTIGGEIETHVTATTEAVRIGQLNRGDRLLNQASEKLWDNATFKPLEGYAKAQFEPKPITPKYNRKQPRKPERPKRERTPQERTR